MRRIRAPERVDAFALPTGALSMTTGADDRAARLFVHLFTATGAVFAMLAMLAAVRATGA
jgi:hypothetical protein